MTDKTLTCVQCQSAFIFSAGEQEFYEQKGFQEPKRCPDCRKQKKAMISHRETILDLNYLMKDFIAAWEEDHETLTDTEEELTQLEERMYDLLLSVAKQVHAGARFK